MKLLETHNKIGIDVYLRFIGVAGWFRKGEAHMAIVPENNQLPR